MKTPLSIRVIHLALPMLIALTPLAFAADQGLDAIDTALQRQDLARANALIDRFLREVPDRQLQREARYYRGLAFLYENQPDAAQDIFSDLLAEQPYGALAERVRLSQVDALFMGGNYAQALVESERVWQDYPESNFQHVNLLNMARAELRLAQWMDARRDLERLVDEFPGTREAETAQQLLQERQYYSVQVGSFLDRERAEEQVARLTDQGEQAYILDVVDHSGLTFYRVRLGRFPQLEEAQILKARLTALGYPARIYP